MFGFNPYFFEHNFLGMRSASKRVGLEGCAQMGFLTLFPCYFWARRWLQSFLAKATLAHPTSLVGLNERPIMFNFNTNSEGTRMLGPPSYKSLRTLLEVIRLLTDAAPEPRWNCTVCPRSTCVPWDQEVSLPKDLLSGFSLTPWVGPCGPSRRPQPLCSYSP